MAFQRTRRPLSTFAALLAAVALVGTTAPRAISPQHSLEACQVKIAIPDTWEALVQPRADNGLCAILMRPNDWLDQVEKSEVEWSEFPLSLRFSEGPFEKATALAGFEKKKDGWVVHGRQGSESAAEFVQGTGWKAIVGEPQIGFHFKKPGFAGIENTFRAVIGLTSGRSAVLDLENPSLRDEARRILESLRYVVPRKR